MKEKKADLEKQVGVRRDIYVDVWNDIKRELIQEQNLSFPDSSAPKAKAEKPEIPPVLVKAQNVFDYFQKHYKEHGWDDLTTFSCARPPFENMVVSYDDDAGKPHWDLRHVDTVVYTRKPEYMLQFKDVSSVGGTSVGSTLLHEFIESGIADVLLNFRVARDTVPLPGSYFVMLEKSGRVLPLAENKTTFIFVRSSEDQKFMVDNNIEFDKLMNIFGHHVSIALATIQFMNCRNVEIIDNLPSRQQRRRAEHEGKKAPITYKTLVIHPVGKKRNITIGEATGVEMPLHICRGHFKDFRLGPGLGKFHTKGMWWWHPMVRGKAEKGRVVKDYEVEPQEEKV